MVAAYGNHHITHAIPFKSGVEHQRLPVGGVVTHVATPHQLESFGILDKSIRQVLDIGVGHIYLAAVEIVATCSADRHELQCLDCAHSFHLLYRDNHLTVTVFIKTVAWNIRGGRGRSVLISIPHHLHIARIAVDIRWNVNNIQY